MEYFLTSAALPIYLVDVGASPSRVGLDIAIGSLSSLVLTLLIGPMISRGRPGVFIAVGATAYLAASVLMLAVPTEAALVGGRLVQGCGYACIGPAALAAAPRLAKKRVGTSIGILSLVSSLPLAIGPAVGLALYAHGGSIWLLLPALAVAGLGLLVASQLRLDGGHPGDDPDYVPLGGRIRRLIWAYGYDRRWTVELIANGLNGVYFGGIIAYLPLFMASIHGPNAGIFYTADAIGVLLLRWPSGMLADRTHPRVPMLLGLVMTLLGLAAFAPPTNVVWLVLAGAGTGIGAGLFANGLLTEMAAVSTERNRGTAMALSLVTPSAGVFVGGWIGGLLYLPHGFGGVIVFGAVAEAIGIPLLLFTHWRKGSGAHPALGNLAPA